MKNYMMKLAYDGTRYKGWQRQKSTEQTIQGKLEHVLSAYANHPVEVIGSGRTDAGVHASGQIANFHIEDTFPLEEIRQQLNAYLPEDIAVLELKEVPERFHSRFSAVEKTYQYRIHTSEIPNVFERKYLYTYTSPLDVGTMKDAAEELVGTWDYMSFCGNKHMKKSTVRTVYDIELQEKETEILITYRGDGFLQNMIRILTGTLIEVGQGKKTPQDMKKILEGKNRELAGYTAPPQGLCLVEVKYQ